MSEFVFERASGSQRDAGLARVPCPNCCRMAPVVETRMGLLFYECELCGTRGATPDPDTPNSAQRNRD